jgi:DNA polymerase-3 subunit alpha
LYRRVVRIKYVGKRPGYDLEVEHPAHNFLLASGLFTSNSHAVFYSINGYITAYLKRHYPAAFLAANLKIKTERGGIAKDEEVSMAKTECRRLGIKIIPPDINKSSANYEILDDKTIVMGFAAIKGMGEKAIGELAIKQPFNSFVDFIDRIDARVINKGKMEVLAKAGSFDSFNITRKDTCESGKKTRDRLVQFIKRRVKDGYDSMMVLEEFPLNFSGQEWDKPELLKHEMEVLGELVSGNLSDLFPGFFTGYNSVPLSKLKKLPDRHEVAVEVLIKSIFREFKIKKPGRYYGKTMIKYFVEDMYGSENELTVWPTEYDRMKKLVGEGGIPIRALCQVSEFNGNKTLMLRELIAVYKSSTNT